MGASHIYYMPLPVNMVRLERMNEVFKYRDNKDVKELIQLLSSQISFLGSMYNERESQIQYEKLNLTSYMRGYLEGVMDAQLKVYGYNFLQELTKGGMFDEAYDDNTNVTYGEVYAKLFNVVDSFDTHARIPEHFDNVDAAAKESGHVGIISVGWDPGMFSLNRMYANAILPDGQDYTFWGKGVSQGHSDAIRRVEGVKDGKQYTIPVEAALEAVRNGENPQLTTRQKHTRECFVVLEEGADAAKVEETIKNMPNYFADYDTTVHFISEEELKEKHSGIPHGGFVIRSGKTGWNKENQHVIEYSLKLDSNPEFTSCVIVAYARAAYRLYKEGQTGCKTVFDIAPAYLSAKDGAELRKSLL